MGMQLTGSAHFSSTELVLLCYGLYPGHMYVHCTLTVHCLRHFELWSNDKYILQAAFL